MKIIHWLLLILSLTFDIACKKDSNVVVPQTSVRKDFILAGENGADVSYQDIVPDWDRYAYGLAFDSINLDLNGDHLTDISIKYSTASTSSGYTVQTTVSPFNGAFFSPGPKNLNDTINASSAWSNTTSILGFTKIDFSTSDTSTSGSWISTSDKFLGVQLTENGAKIFGWVRISLHIHPETIYLQEIIIKDYACRKD